MFVYSFRLEKYKRFGRRAGSAVQWRTVRILADYTLKTAVGGFAERLNNR
jgi:hypothetical protein